MQSGVVSLSMALMEQQESPVDAWAQGYNDENSSALRKVVMRKRIRMEDFIFLRPPAAPAAAQDVTGCYSCPVPNVFPFLCAVQHLWGEREVASKATQDNEPGLHLLTKAWDVTITQDLNANQSCQAK